MKIIRIIILLLINIIFNNNVFANVVNNFKNRLNKINSFHATVIQTVTYINSNNNTNIVQEVDFFLKRPNLFKWHIIKPYESIFVSDGKNLWIYNPFLEQVTVTLLKDSFIDTPLKFITNKNFKYWNFYNIKQEGDNFIITPKITNKNNYIKIIFINLDKNGIIHKFSAITQDNHYCTYTFKYLQKGDIKTSIFNFFPPVGITLDDQRK